MSRIWDEKPELVERLKTLWADGLSCSQIARALGSGVTRCAVIGKAARLGISNRAPSVPTVRPRYTAPRIVRVPLPPIPEPTELLKTDGGEMVTLMMVSDRHCRYPMNVDGAETYFCGRPPKPGSSYCEPHHRKCHVPPNVKPPEGDMEQSVAAERASGIRRAFG